MTRRRKKKDSGNGDAGEARSSERPDSDDVKAGPWSDDERKLRWRKFPATGLADEALRVTFSRTAYADLISHTKANLDEEVCGVLAGDFCEDELGAYVSVAAVVMGTSTKRGAAHVTYTHETWAKIHETLAEEHPKLRIVGWYHSHPGFGVEFSDMDLFVQENFFADPLQIAIVVDPLGGEESICFMGGSGIEYLPRFWVEQRERNCHVAADANAAARSGDPGSPDEMLETMRMVHDRLKQNLAAVEELRTVHYKFLLTLGALVAVGVVFAIGHTMYSTWAKSRQPPQIEAFVPGPVKVGGEWRWIGSSLVTRALDPKVEAELIELEKMQLLQAIQEELDAQQAEQTDAEGADADPPAEDEE